MANVYTTSTKVLDELPSSVPTAVSSKIDGWIADESRAVDSALPNYTTPFADIAASPATPALIEEATRYLVIDRALRKSGLLRYDALGKLVDSYEVKGKALLRDLRDGARVLPA